MSDYILDLRRLVGHRPLLQAGASVLLEDGEGRLLLQRRADCGLWGYHGGSVELDEAVEEAANKSNLQNKPKLNAILIMMLILNLKIMSAF